MRIRIAIMAACAGTFFLTATLVHAEQYLVAGVPDLDAGANAIARSNKKVETKSGGYKATIDWGDGTPSNSVKSKKSNDITLKRGLKSPKAGSNTEWKYVPVRR